MVLGMVAGYTAGLVGGALIALPAMFAGELMTMPLSPALACSGACSGISLRKRRISGGSRLSST